jgi:hypothetical protein
MSNINKATVDTVLATNLDMFKNNAAKGVSKMIAVRLHYAACFATYHAAMTGDTRPLNTFFNGLRQNDKDALRLWVGKLCTFTVVEEATGVESEKKFISFKKDAAFSIVKGTEAVRSEHFVLADMLAGASFLDINQDAEKKTLGLAEILAALARIEKQTSKKAEENGVELPANIKAMLGSLTETVTAVGNTMGAKLN